MSKNKNIKSRLRQGEMQFFSFTAMPFFMGVASASQQRECCWENVLRRLWNIGLARVNRSGTLSCLIHPCTSHLIWVIMQKFSYLSTTTGMKNDIIWSRERVKPAKSCVVVFSFEFHSLSGGAHVEPFALRRTTCTAKAWKYFLV